MLSGDKPPVVEMAEHPFDEDGLAKLPGHAPGDEPRRDVGRTTGGTGQDDTDGAVALRGGRCGGQLGVARRGLRRSMALIPMENWRYEEQDTVKKPTLYPRLWRSDGNRNLTLSVTGSNAAGRVGFCRWADL